jgi:hypothetical protein
MNATNILRPLAFGEVLDSAFTLYRRNFSTFVAVALAPTLAMFAAALLAGFPFSGAGIEGGGALPGLTLFIVAAMVGTIAMWNALTHLSSQAYGGLPISFGEGYRVGLARFLPMLGSLLVAIVLLMAVFAAIALVVALGAGILAMLLLGGGESAIAVVVGVLVGVLILALYAVSGAFFFAVFPAVVVEGRGPLSAIARSVQLARGALGRLVALIIVCAVIVYLPIIGVVMLTGTFATLYDPAAAAAAQGSTAFLLQQSVTMLSGALTTPFFVSALVVQYYDRRVRTEALDVQVAADRLAMG